MTKLLITLEHEPSFNLALALYLKGDVAKAKATLESMKELCKMRETIISESCYRSSS